MGAIFITQQVLTKGTEGSQRCFGTIAGHHWT